MRKTFSEKNYVKGTGMVGFNIGLRKSTMDGYPAKYKKENKEIYLWEVKFIQL